MRTVFLTIICSSVFALLFFVLRGREEARHQAELAALKSDIAAAARAHPAPVYQITVPDRAASSEFVSGTGNPRGAANTPIPEPPADLQPPRTVEDIATEFEAEPRDSGLMRTLGAELSRKAVQALPQGSSVREVDCRGQLCKLRTEHTDESSLDVFVDKLFLHPAPDNLQGAIHFTPIVTAADGKVTSVAFVETRDAE